MFRLGKRKKNFFSILGNVHISELTKTERTHIRKELISAEIGRSAMMQKSEEVQLLFLDNSSSVLSGRKK